MAVGLAAGGTGGHLFPAEAVARELLRRGHRPVIYTDRRGAGYVKALEGLEHLVLPARSLEGGVRGKLAAAVTIIHAVARARADMARRKVVLLVGFGGYPSFAPALAAKLRRTPLLLHEQATRLSLANRKLLPYADVVATSFPRVDGLEEFDQTRVIETGNPVRQAILQARTDYPPLDQDTPLHLLVVGGSQSARVFGKVVPAAVHGLLDNLRNRLRLSLQYKGDDAYYIARELAEAGIQAEIRPFFDDMGARLRRAHLVIARAGATTAADLLTMGRPGIFVPIPHGGSREEQRRNAETLARAGAGWCVPEADLTPAALTLMLEELFSSPERLPQAARAAQVLARPYAAVALADQIERMLAVGR